MIGLGERTQRSSLVECNRERDRRRGIDRMQVRTGDFDGVLVQRDVADRMLGERRMLRAGAHGDRHGEPFPPLHRVGSDERRRVLRVVTAVQLAKLRCELLCLLLRMVTLRRGNRLSITPVTAAEWKIVEKLSGSVL